MHCAHVFTTVSEITAVEAQHILHRRPGEEVLQSISEYKIFTTTSASDSDCGSTAEPEEQEPFMSRELMSSTVVKKCLYFSDDSQPPGRGTLVCCKNYIF